ncbi:hypothetical protein D3C74_48960 [compost metagenome]
MNFKNTNKTAFRTLSNRVYSLWREVITMPKTYWEYVQEKGKVDGYVMKNDLNGVQISCTEKFVKAWTERGFRIVEQKTITLLD